MQTISKQLTQTSVETDEDFVTTTYTCDVRADIAGDSIWDCTLTAADDVRINTICVTEGVVGGDYDGYTSVNVYYTVNGEEEYEDSWRLYTDEGFADTVSELLGERIYFTEQGMQEDGMASMEC
jgi:hypothetical protein